MMNDLTKEELEIILLWGIDRAESIGLEEFKKEKHDFVYKKIQYMIDSYDKHSIMCPKCNNVRVADGMCCNMECDYREN